MPTRFKLDENLPRDAEVLLQQAGHDVHTMLAEQLGGASDPRVFDASQAEERVLVTFDLDFPISAFTLQQVTMASGYCAHTRKVPRTHWLYCDPRCESLKMNLPEGGCGSLSPNGFAFVSSW